MSLIPLPLGRTLDEQLDIAEQSYEQCRRYRPTTGDERRWKADNLRQIGRVIDLLSTALGEAG